MADSDDDVAPPRASRAAIYTLLADVHLEELEGIEDDDEAIDDLLGDMVEDINLTDGEDDEGALDDVGPDEQDESDIPSDASTSTRAARLHAAKERQAYMNNIRKMYGFGANVRLDIVDVDTNPSFADWITNPKYADATSERAMVHNAIRNAMIPNSSDTPPPMGDCNTFDVPRSIEDIKLPKWAARVAPLLIASNTVSTIQTDCETNQERLAINHGTVTFNPMSFAAVKIRSDPTALVFRRRIVVAGARGQRASMLACLYFTYLLQRMDPMYFVPTCKMQNIVCNARCFPIDLAMLAERYPVNSRYDVSRFPGLVFRFCHGKSWVFIIFPCNVIGTGFDDWNAVNLAWRWLFSHVLVQFKDSTAMGRETAAEKKNIAFNNSTIFAKTVRSIALVGVKRACEQLFKDESEQNRTPYDVKAAWRELANNITEIGDVR